MFGSFQAWKYRIRGRPATEPLYPIDPFESDGLARMFKTHPPLEERVRRLRELGAGGNGRVASVDELAG